MGHLDTIGVCLIAFTGYLFLFHPPNKRDELGITRNPYTGKIVLGPYSKRFFLEHRHLLKPGADTSLVSPLDLAKLRQISREAQQDPSILG